MGLQLLPVFFSWLLITLFCLILYGMLNILYKAAVEALADVFYLSGGLIG